MFYEAGLSARLKQFRIILFMNNYGLDERCYHSPNQIQYFEDFDQILINC